MCTLLHEEVLRAGGEARRGRSLCFRQDIAAEAVHEGVQQGFTLCNWRRLGTLESLHDMRLAAHLHRVSHGWTKMQ